MQECTIVRNIQDNSNSLEDFKNKLLNIRVLSKKNDDLNHPVLKLFKFLIQPPHLLSNLLLYNLTITLLW